MPVLHAFRCDKCGRYEEAKVLQERVAMPEGWVTASVANSLWVENSTPAVRYLLEPNRRPLANGKTSKLMTYCAEERQELQNRVGRLTALLTENILAVQALTRRLDIMAASVQDLDAILATANTDATALQTSNAALLAKLTQLQAANPAIDLSSEIAHVQSIDAVINALTAAQTTALTPSTPAPTSAPAPVAATAPVAVEPTTGTTSGVPVS